MNTICEYSGSSSYADWHTLPFQKRYYGMFDLHSSIHRQTSFLSNIPPHRINKRTAKAFHFLVEYVYARGSSPFRSAPFLRISIRK